MLDIKIIRENPELVKQGAKRKKIQAPVDELLEADRIFREQSTRLDQLRHEQKEGNKKVASAKSTEERNAHLAAMKTLSATIKELESQNAEQEKKVKDLSLRIPNLPSQDVPDGESDADNKPVKHWGEPRKFSFTPKDHVALGEALDILDIQRGARISGSRNYILKREAVLLEWAVLRFALDHMMKKGFIPLGVPLLVRDEAMVGTAYFPGGEEQAYRTEKDSLNLIGTSEVPVTSYHAGEILEEKDLPKRYMACSSCFRREAGTYGKDTKGLYRVHQFMKVEQVVVDIGDAAKSTENHEFITRNAEEVIEAFGLPYRRVLVCGGDLGVPQVKKYDIETWMPSRNGYGETHSSSQFHEFQSRRLNLRYRDAQGKVRFCHTLNNTVIASPRILIALLENYQREDGSVEIPAVLQPYMNGLKEIRR